MNSNYLNPVTEEDELKLPAEVVKWVKNVGKTKHIDLMSWASDYASYFCDQEKTWPQSHRFKKGNREYYDIRVKKNRFNLDNFYQKLGEFEYLKGKKRYLEVLIMYKWIVEIDTRFSDYYPEYIKEGKFLK